MMVFWLLAAVVSGAAAFLILARAAAAERSASTPDPALGVYRRQLEELDDLADRGLLGADEHRAARAEAARRLIGEADRGESQPPSRKDGARRLVMVAAALGPILALAGYLAVGSPGLPDQPFRDRLKAWQQISRQNPRRLRLPEMAALLEQDAKAHPDDPRPLVFLAKAAEVTPNDPRILVDQAGAEAAGGDAASAVRTLERATQIAPDSADVWTALGEARSGLAQGEVTVDARRAFERALALKPGAPAPRYYLAQAKIVAGQTAEGLQDWRALAASLPVDAPARAPLEADIAAVTRTGHLPAAAPPPSSGGDQAAFIQSMVDRLAARLRTQPDDPAGWARLIRAYAVLGQADKRAAAIAEARRLYKDRPDALKTALAGEAVPPR